MHQRPDPKKALLKRTLIYVLMVLGVLAGLFLIVFMMLGYRFDFSSRTVEQTGLVQYSSTPRGATVTIDGQELSSRTNTKSMVLPGNHTFEIKRSGYMPWKKDLLIDAGTVTWLDYVRLVPENRVVNTVKTFPSLEDARFAPFGRFLASFNKKNQPVMQITDLRNENDLKQTQVKFNTANLTGYADRRTKHSFSVREWDQGGRYVLVKHAYQYPDETSPRSEWLLVDREKPNEVKNITKTINLDATDMRLSGSSGNDVYMLQQGGDIRKITLNDGEISSPLVSNVREFDLYGTDLLTFVCDDTSNAASPKVVAGFKRENDRRPTTIMSVERPNDKRQLNIKLSRYFYQDTIAVSFGDKVTFYRGELPRQDDAKGLKTFLDSAKEFTFSRPIAFLSFSGNGRFIVANDRYGFISYDLERSSLSKETRIDGIGNNAVRWLDDYHIWNIRDGKLIMEEFDGVNANELFPATPGFDATLSQDRKFTYGFVKKAKGTEVELRRLDMIAKE